MANPIPPLVVSSVEEVRRLIRGTMPNVELRFDLAPDTSLGEAHLMWRIVSSDEGGYGELINPDLLGNKEEALRFVSSRMDKLRAWKVMVDGQLALVLDEVSRLKELIEAGGPGARAGYAPHVYDGSSVVIDLDEDIDDDDLETHVAAVQALYLQRTPASPDGDEQAIKRCQEREVLEQRDIARFNLAYLQVKAKCLETLSAQLEVGIRGLEDEFISQPSYLGASEADFVRFSEIDI